MNLQFTKATKEKSKLRLAIFGPSGSGKTYTSLRIGTGLGGNIALIDTERGSASKYADRFEFDVLDLPSKDIATYVAAVNAAAQAGYPVLVIDSLTHAWHDLLDEVDRLARAKYKGNTWSAWSEGTPKQRQLVDALLEYPGHIIASMRTKTEWTTETDSRGKSKPIRVGLAPEQGKSIEYEFDLLMEMSVDHIGTVIKDRTGKYQDQIIDKPGEDLGAELSAWLSSGSAPAPKPEKKAKEQPKAEPKAETNGRPYTPEVLRDKLTQAAEAYTKAGKTATEKERKVLAAQLGTLFGGDDTKRYEATKYLAGVSSTKDLSDGMVKAMLEKWLGVDNFGLMPFAEAIDEAKTLTAAALTAAGQQEFFAHDGDIDPKTGMPFGDK